MVPTFFTAEADDPMATRRAVAVIVDIECDQLDDDKFIPGSDTDGEA